MCGFNSALTSAFMKQYSTATNAPWNDSSVTSEFEEFFVGLIYLLTIYSCFQNKICTSTGGTNVPGSWQKIDRKTAKWFRRSGSVQWNKTCPKRWRNVFRRVVPAPTSIWPTFDISWLLRRLVLVACCRSPWWFARRELNWSGNKETVTKFKISIQNLRYQNRCYDWNSYDEKNLFDIVQCPTQSVIEG